MDALSKERKNILNQVNWSSSLMSRLQQQWGLSSDVLNWLWRPLEQARHGQLSCDIIHPADAVLSTCLSEEGQSDVGRAIRELLVNAVTSWLAVWKEMKKKVTSVQTEASTHHGQYKVNSC